MGLLEYFHKKEKVKITEEEIEEAIKRINPPFTASDILEEIYKKEGVSREYERKHFLRDISSVIKYLNKKPNLKKLSVYYESL